MGERLALLQDSADETAVYPVALAPEDFTFYEPETPKAIPIAELPQEEWTQRRFRKFLGAVMLEGEVAADQEVKQPDTYMNLLQALEEARLGSKEANDMVDINIGTTIGELSFKKDHVSRIKMKRTPEGHLIQFGQTMTAMHRNSLLRPNRPAPLQQLTKIEALNGHRVEDLQRAGLLEDNIYVVPSFIPPVNPLDPNRLAEKDLGDEGEGYFLSSMTYSLQATTEIDGEIVTDAAFLAGVIAENYKTTEERMENRHDLAAFQRVCTWLGIKPPQDHEEALHGYLIDKRLLKNGVAGLMKLCDQAAQEITGEKLLRPDEFYDQLHEVSRHRQESLSSVHRSVKEELLVWSSGNPQADMFEATNALWEIATDHTQTAALTNMNIQADAWGSEEATLLIISSRQKFLAGDLFGAVQDLQSFKEVAVGTGCGGGAKGRSNERKDSSSESNTDSRSGSGGGAGAAGMNADKGLETKLKWRTGYCRVDSKVCLEKGKKTLVAQCDVCIKCQTIYFDKNIDPTKFSKSRSFFDISNFEKAA